MAGIGRNRVYDRAALEELKEQAQALLTCASEVTEELQEEMEKLLSVASEVPGEAYHAGLTDVVTSLRGQLDGSIYENLNKKIQESLEKLCSLIPLYDAQGAVVVEELSAAAKNLALMVEELKSLIRQGSLTLSMEEFQKQLQKCEEKWKAERMSLEGKMLLAMTYLKGLTATSAFSKDPVNLSTGNFFYEKEDLKIGGTPPFVFKRYYNALDCGGSALGNGWSHSHGEYLEQAGEDFILHKADGKEISFRKEGKDYRDIHSGAEMLCREQQGYVYEEGKNLFLHFGEKGELLSRCDREGKGIFYSLDEQGRVVKAE